MRLPKTLIGTPGPSGPDRGVKGPPDAYKNGCTGLEGEGTKVTVMEVVKLAERYLGEHGIDSARLNAEHLLAKILGCSRLDLYLRFDEHCGEDALALYRKYIKRRAEHYPLQYIMGEVEFYSLSFRVREGVFIPRPETELLVECIEEALRGDSEMRFLEFGVGAGVISGTLTARHPLWKGAAFDISQDAVALAVRNFKALGVTGRIATFVAGGFEAVLKEPVFDLLVANPPYIPSGVIAKLQEEVSKYETRTCIEGGEDGLMFYPLLAKAGVGLLRPGGLLALEIGDGQANSVEGILRRAGYGRISMRRDYNGMERVISASRPKPRDGGSDG